MKSPCGDTEIQPEMLKALHLEVFGWLVCVTWPVVSKGHRKINTLEWLPPYTRSETGENAYLCTSPQSISIHCLEQGSSNFLSEGHISYYTTVRGPDILRNVIVSGYDLFYQINKFFVNTSFVLSFIQQMK